MHPLRTASDAPNEHLLGSNLPSPSEDARARVRQGPVGRRLKLYLPLESQRKRLHLVITISVPLIFYTSGINMCPMTVFDGESCRASGPALVIILAVRENVNTDIMRSAARDFNGIHSEWIRCQLTRKLIRFFNQHIKLLFLGALQYDCSWCWWDV